MAKTIIAALLIGLIGWTSICCARGEEPGSLTVTVYNQGMALVNEIRSMQLPGQGMVEFTGVAETIEPTSLQVRSLTAPDKFRVLDMNYEYDLVDTRNLLDRYVGKELRVVLPDPKGLDGHVTRKATLLANNDRPVFEVDGNIWVGDYEAALLPEMPQGLRAHPTLVWLVDNDGPRLQDIEVSYIAGSMRWSADYVLKLDRDNTTASLSGWVTLDNQSGMAFKGASLKLVAGDVNRAVRPQPMMKGGERLLMAEAAPDMEEEAFFEYHLYNVERPVDVGNRQTKQIALLSSPQLKVRKELVSRSYVSSSQRGPDPQRQEVNVYVAFENDKESGLGLPLPAGVVRAYQQSQDGSTLLVGEDGIDHTPDGDTVRLHLGDAFDVTVDRRMRGFEKTGKREHELIWELEIKNAKSEPVTVVLQEVFRGEWKIIEASDQYEKPTSSTAEFIVTVPAKGSRKVKYEVTVGY